MTAKTESAWLNLHDAANYVGLNERTLRNYIRDGILTAYNIGPRLVRVKRQDLDNLHQPILRPID